MSWIIIAFQYTTRFHTVPLDLVHLDKCGLRVKFPVQLLDVNFTIFMDVRKKNIGKNNSTVNSRIFR